MQCYLDDRLRNVKLLQLDFKDRSFDKKMIVESKTGDSEFDIHKWRRGFAVHDICFGLRVVIDRVGDNDR